MKKIIAILLCTLAVLCAASCTAKEELNGKPVAGTPGEDIVGKWKYSSNEDIRDVITEVLQDPNVYVDLYYEFYEDGTGKTYISTDDTVLEFSYEFDGEVLTIISKDGPFDTPCSLSEDGKVLSVYDEANDEYLDLKKQ